MVRRKISWKVYLTAAAMTVTIFFVGLELGIILSNEKYQTIRYELEQLQVQQRDIEFELLVFNTVGNQMCDTLSYEIKKTGNSASDLGEKVTKYNEDEIKEVSFDVLKKNYMITLIQFWSYWEIFKKNCNSSVNTILYFYSVEGCGDCEPQGYVLSFLKYRYPEKIMIFAIDINEELYSIDLLKNIYNITTTPALIINNKKYEGLLGAKELEELLAL